MDTAGDIRLKIFRDVMGRRIVANLVAEAPGVLSGIQRARERMEMLGLEFSSVLRDGQSIEAHQRILQVTGNPYQVALAEDQIIGTLSKSSGIATAARRARQQAGPRLKVVSGGWKKMPAEIKELVRQAVRDGGLMARMCDLPFVYLDKNYVRIFGGIRAALEAGMAVSGRVVIQIRGETAPVAAEAVEAAEAGASVIMVDTGSYKDLSNVIQILNEKGLRSSVRIAFAGGISLEEIVTLSGMDLDIVDIGHEIIDSNCLPMRFDVARVP